MPDLPPVLAPILPSDAIALAYVDPDMSAADFEALVQAIHGKANPDG